MKFDNFITHILIIFAVIFFNVFLFYGCATQSANPVMPKYNTDQQKACARQCQQTYAFCNSGCAEMKGGLTTAKQREKCLNNCNQILADCYSTCE